MEGNATKPKKPIRHSQRLCAGEQEYIQKRKHGVRKTLMKLGIHTEEAVPHIALLASGGGQRAAVSLVGSLHQLAQDGLLDALLYLASVSGSTWSMASIYSDPHWSTKIQKTASPLMPEQVELEEVMFWLGEKAQGEDFSLTDVWGVLTAVGIMKEWDTRKFSDEAARNATNPYPIYCAMEKYCFKNGPTEGKWFEMSPHEVGFTELGLFVKTSLLGSKFEGGVVTEKVPELDMIQLQGILGSALADEDSIGNFVPAWLKEAGNTDSAAEQYLRCKDTINTIIYMAKGYVTSTEGLELINNLQKMLEDKYTRHNESMVLESQNSQDRMRQFQQWTAELLTVVQDWAKTLPDGPVKALVSLLVAKLIPLIQHWEWGTVNNFLYKYKEVPFPEWFRSEENIHLIDAGLYINGAYPSFLGEKRDIDLIIAPEYSAGKMFTNLTLARAYAAEVNKPFPELDDKVLEADRDWPKACYVFDGKDKAPTIVFMPLFNQQNCKDAEEWKQKMEQFATIQRSYTPQMIEDLLKTAKANMRNNKETLLREIHKAVQRRNKKSRK